MALEWALLLSRKSVWLSNEQGEAQWKESLGCFSNEKMPSVQIL